ncbi:MAG: aspartate--tRNA ligase, partial [Marinilabiliales bacterium]
KGSIIWVDLRDRYGITQLVFDEAVANEELMKRAKKLGREFVVKVQGKVIERESKNKNIPTGEIEIRVDKFEILSKSEVPPFTIEDETDGGEELRMKYRYLDIRRNPVKEALMLRHKVAKLTRDYLDSEEFIEVETPVLIKSTPEGARDFVVPSRMHPGQFYALPQSPQQFKQLLMVSGMDKYFQVVKCFRDEDFRADRQPEFTQIDCEMSFVSQQQVLETFERLITYLFKEIKGIQFETFPQMPYKEAIESYGTDKPDLRFDMKIHELTNMVQGKNFVVFDSVEYVGGICVKNCGGYSRKQLDKLTDFVKKPQIGAKGLVYVKCNEDGSMKSSVDKFYTEEDLKQWASLMGAGKGDLLLVLAGDKAQTLRALGELRLEMANQLELKDKNKYVPLWVVDFPLLEWDEDTQRFHAMHHPFTAPFVDDVELLESKPAEVRAQAYDMVINGVEVGGGSIRIHNTEMQQKMFSHLGFTREEAQAQFGFLMNAFKYGAPPHGGVAFGFDRLVSLFGGTDSIRDYIAFPKNNAGKDIMIDSPSAVDNKQLKDLGLALIKKEAE